MLPAILAVFFFIRPALFYSFRFLIIVYRSHACAAYCVLVGGEGGGWQGGREGRMDYLSHSFDALFHDGRHWRVNHCNAARAHVCSNLTKYVTVVCNGDEMRFSQCVFLRFFFLFLNAHCSISSGISLLLTRIFMAVIARYLWSRLCNHRIA